MSKTFRFTALLLLAWASVVLAGKTKVGKSKKGACKGCDIFTIQQDAPKLTNTTLGGWNIVAFEAATRTENIVAFEAATRTEAGKKSGLLIGTLTTVRITPDEEERLGNLVFRFDDGEFIVQGASAYPLSQLEMANNDPQVRAVLGGTGAYIGVRGQVSTVRNPDKTYTHTMVLLPN
eukprot:g62497.t1